MATMLKRRAMRTGALAFALLAGTSLPALAATISFDLTTGGTNSGSGLNNTRTFSSGGVTVTITGWSTTGGGGTLDRAQVNQFSTGLGICNANEGTGCSDPQHQVDNVGAMDYVLFQFSVPVDPLSVTVDPFGNYDRDVRYYINSAALTLATVDASLPSAIGTEFNDYDSSNGSTSAARTVNILGSTSVRTLLVGTPNQTNSPNTNPDKWDDYWKLKTLVIDFTAAPPPPPPPPSGAQVPAPGALALFGAALAGLAVTRRRRD